MKHAKIIFIAMEVAMILGVIMLTFATDWQEATEHGAAWMYKLLTVLCALNAVVFQREQQAIEWNNDEE